MLPEPTLELLLELPPVPTLEQLLAFVTGSGVISCSCWTVGVDPRKRKPMKLTNSSSSS